MVLRYIHLSWRARGERERDVGPIKKIITRFHGTSSSPNFDAPRSRKQTGVTSTSNDFFSFSFYFLDANTRRPCKRHYSNIADISRRPKIIPVSFFIPLEFPPLRRVPFISNEISPFTTNATRSLPEAVD